MINLSVCIGTSCHLNGAKNVVSTFQHLIEENNLHDKVKLTASFCANNCNADTVAVTVGDEKHRIYAQDARKFFKEQILAIL